MGLFKEKNEKYLDRTKFRTREETIKELTSRWKPKRESESVESKDTLGRTASEDVFSINTLPLVRAATADGVAIKSKSFHIRRPDVRKWKLGIDYAPADMGDDFPDDFDAVIAVENFHFSDDGTILSLSPKIQSVKKGDMIRDRGSLVKEGEKVIFKDDTITSMRLGYLLSSGVDMIKCYRRPRVGYIPTGSELIYVGSTPQRGENIETNSYLVSSYLENTGADFVKYPIIRDKESDLERGLEKALDECDIVLINGGTSMGTEDYSSVLLSKRAEYYQHGVRSIPGMPVAVAIIDNKPVVNLPGPPFATFCALEWCVEALVDHYYGRCGREKKKVKSLLTSGIKKPKEFEIYLRFHVEKKDGCCYATPLSRNMREAEVRHLFNGYAVLPIGLEGMAEGEEIEVILLE